jgi:hypothetical protein
VILSYFRGLVPSRAQHALDGLGCLVDQFITSGRVGCSPGDAVPQVLLEEVHPDPLERLGDRGDLGEHVDAVRVLLDESLQAAYLALDATEAGKNLLLLVGVPR